MARRQRKSSGRMASKRFPNPIDVHLGGRIRLRRTLLGISQVALPRLLIAAEHERHRAVGVPW
jgi:hypothetical protein